MTLNVVSVGLGTMGPGVAVDYLAKGHRVTLAGRDERKLVAARQRAEAALNFLAAENFLPAENHRVALENLATARMDQPGLFEKAAIVVESIPENMALKQQFFKELEEVCPPETLFLSNTSSLVITEIFRGLRYPGRAMGTHYWNPPYLMPLVELTPGELADPERVEEVYQLLASLGKTPIRVGKELPGLIWNRLQFALFRECLHLLEQGVATVEELDQVIQKGLARRSSFMGLFKVADLGGGDVWHGIASYTFPELSNMTQPPAVWNEMIERGEFGLKTGQGFYKWDQATAQALLKARDHFLSGKLKEDAGT
jgi:3-hydroxybutyryl-CoA dehydrogenase